jgi:hypothetical protein
VRDDELNCKGRDYDRFDDIRYFGCEDWAMMTRMGINFVVICQDLLGVMTLSRKGFSHYCCYHYLDHQPLHYCSQPLHLEWTGSMRNCAGKVTTTNLYCCLSLLSNVFPTGDVGQDYDFDWHCDCGFE